MAKLYAGAEWIGPAHSENYFSGRIGYGFYDRGKQYSITAIGLHHTATTLQGAIDTFKAAPASGRQHSAHFIVDLDGTRYQMLDTNDTAFALGDEVANCYTVNIEIVQTWDFAANVKTSDFTDAQYTSVSELCQIVAADNGFPTDADRIHGHNFWTPTACPGDLDIARIISGGGPEVLDANDPLVKRLLAAVEAIDTGGIVGQAGATRLVGDMALQALAELRGDTDSLRGALADLKAHPAVGNGDPELKAIAQRIEAALRNA